MWTKLVTAIALVLAGALATPALADETPRSSLVWWQFETDFSSAHVVIADAQARHARALTNPGPGF